MQDELLEALLAKDQAAAVNELGVAVPESWLDEMKDHLEMRLDQSRSDPRAGPWLLRAVIVRAPERIVIGYINFHGPPEDPGWVEIGYDILPEHRRKGFATEAATAMFDWAASRHGITRMRASISPENEPSLKMIAKLGFTRVGEQIDEIDGLEWIFERDWPPGA
jgi:[ribosomal protein S5]-alanine N-acetyltransferase